MSERIIRNAVVTYDLEGAPAYGFHGQTVDLTAEDEARLDKLGALVAPGGETARSGDLGGITDETSDAEVDQFVASGSVTEIAAYAEKASPALASRILEAEQASDKPRTTLVTRLTAISEANASA